MRKNFPALVVIISSALTISCATLSPAERKAQVTAKNAAAIERAQKLGRAIYENDAVSARATDVIIYEGKVNLGNDAFRGWVTLPRGGGYVVQFVTQLPDGRYAATHEVRFPAGALREEDANAFSPPHPLEPEAAAMVRARQTAGKRVERMCGNGTNYVVLPAALEGKDGWLVYLLGSSNRADQVVLAGHLLFRVSADGTHIEEEIPLSKSCLVAETKPETTAFIVTHPLGPVPTETHVFASLLFGIKLYVGTNDRTVWVVEKGAIRYLDEVRSP